MSTIVTESLDERLAARVALEREARGWPVAELAERSGVSRAMISKIERGEVKPTASLLGKLSTGSQLATVALVLLLNATGWTLPGLRVVFVVTLALTIASALHYVYLASVRRGTAAR